MLPQPVDAINAHSRSVYHAAEQSRRRGFAPFCRRPHGVTAADAIFVNVADPAIPTVNDVDSTILQHRSRTGRRFTNSTRPPNL